MVFIYRSIFFMDKYHRLIIHHHECIYVCTTDDDKLHYIIMPRCVVVQFNMKTNTQTLVHGEMAKFEFALIKNVDRRKKNSRINVDS